jgi:hypothetical protein
MWYLAKSKIHGVGIFTDKPLKMGDTVDVAIDKDRVVTDFGSKINHSWKQNSELYYLDGLYYIRASQFIPADTELTSNYMNTPEFIRKPNLNWK